MVVKHNVDGETDIWALYGHLDAQTSADAKVGAAVKKGDVIGRMGPVEENGGWPVRLTTLSHHSLPTETLLEDNDGLLRPPLEGRKWGEATHQ